MLESSDFLLQGTLKIVIAPLTIGEAVFTKVLFADEHHLIDTEDDIEYNSDPHNRRVL